MTRPLIVANCSGFYGDRMSAAREMVTGGPIDVLTGDWLAELTMLILAKDKQRGGGGYARTFVKQVADVLPDCLDRGIKIVSNAGGLDPKACADAIREVATGLGLSPSIAYVTGDDATDRMDELRRASSLTHLDTGEDLGDQAVLTANAYLGGWAIAEALSAGADIVVTGRVTDAAIIVGPAAWHHGWSREDFNELAGAVAAGHVIECGPQATGGNFSFFHEIEDMRRPGFPIAEIAADGSSIITKHPGTGGAVTTETVTAQLLYEIGGPTYLNPDVATHFGSIQVEQIAPDRVQLSGVRGSAPPETLKFGITVWGGFRTTMSVPLTGLDIEAKAELIEAQLWASLGHGPDGFREYQADLLRTDHADPTSNEAATAWLRMTFRDDDADKVGKSLTRAYIELGLASIPGTYFGGESVNAQAYGTFWPTLIGADHFVQTLTLDDGTTRDIPFTKGAHLTPDATDDGGDADALPPGETRRVPLGELVGARSGDKGGNANLGVWARNDAVGAWLQAFLTTEKLRELMPDLGDLDVRRYPLPNLRAVNFVIVGLLGDGIAAGPRQDGQAKALGEYLRARYIDAPISLLPR